LTYSVKPKPRTWPVYNYMSRLLQMDKNQFT